MNPLSFLTGKDPATVTQLAAKADVNLVRAWLLTHTGFAVYLSLSN